METGPVVVVDSSIFQTEGHIKRDFCRHTGSEATGILKVRQEGISANIGKLLSDGRIQGNGIRYGQRSGEKRTPRRDDM